MIQWDDLPAELKMEMSLDMMLYGKSYCKIERGKVKRIFPFSEDISDPGVIIFKE